MGEVDKKRYRMFYPHPAQDLDVEAARKRVLEHPEIMPPHPEPVRLGNWGSRERVVGMRYAGLFGALALGLLAPLLLGAALGWASNGRGSSAYLARARRVPMARRLGGNGRRRGSVFLLARR